MLAQQAVNGILLGSVYALVAVAFTFTVGVLKFLNFSIPAIFMLAGMLTWQILGLTSDLLVVAAGVLACAGAASLAVERFTYARMSRGDHLVPLVSSLAFLILLENLALVAWGSDLKRVVPPFPAAFVEVAGVIVGIPQFVSLAAAIAAVAVLRQVLARTQVGRSIRTIAEDPEVATMLGINVRRLVPAIFMIGGGFAALAGMLFALNYQQVGPYIGDEVALKGISAMVIGGLGSVWGAIAGGLLIGIVEAGAIHYFGARSVDVAVYGTLLLLLLVRPAGLFGLRAASSARA